MSQLGTVSYSVGRVAALAGVTIRTLHHYDEVGLLSPSGRSAAGYRIYEESDLERLQQILFYRELGFTLQEIATIVDDPRTDALGHLRRQRQLLSERIARLGAMVDAIDYEMEARTMDIPLTSEERLEVFGEFRPEDYAEEAGQRWGGTEAYRQSQRRVATYKKEDWQRLKAEEEQVRADLAAAFEAGSAPQSEEAMAAAEAHRQHISRWFYDCTHEIHRGLTDMYVSDERFRAHYEATAPGLSGFLREAAHANAGRAESG
ncbi:MAG: MerR family transcriptional regulator [Actinomycetota bacterium]|nr:MerR family transcriptional regulator [Actinomycetota bacterium]